MIITTKKNSDAKQVEEMITLLEEKGFSIVPIHGESYSVFGIVGDTAHLDEGFFVNFTCVENILRVSTPYKKASRMFHPLDTIVEVNGIKIGGMNPIVMIGGPCAVESDEGLLRIAQSVKASGAKMLRGGAYKPRTSPYSFQGLGEEGIKDLVHAKNETGLAIVSELMSIEHLQEFIDNVDIIQVGARNMQNFDLLKELGKTNKPILLKRGLANTIEEWLMSAEYILANGNANVILCERGIRTFEKYTRNTLDLSVVPLVKKLSHLPIIIDPSHATGRYDLVEPIALAAIACGADGLIIEVHDNPAKALSDGAQSLKPEKYSELINKGRQIAKIVGRDI